MPATTDTPRRTNTRSARTHAAVLDALEALVREGDPAPSARDVATRAGVSVRSVFSHFSSVEELHAEMAERVVAEVADLVEPIDHDAPLVRRIVALCEQRATLNEHIAPLRRAAALQRATSPALAEVRVRARRASRAQLAALFDTELSGLDEGRRQRRLAILDAQVSGETWDQLTTEDGLDVEEAILATTEAVTSLFAPAPTPRRAPGHRSANDEATDPRVERLLDALEAGGPVELITPRLRRLHEAGRGVSR